MMHFGTIAVQPRAALDPVGWIVLAIILFNVLSPIFIRRKPKPAQQPARQPVQQITLTKSVQAKAAPQKVIGSATLSRGAPAVARTIVTLSEEDQAKLRQALAAGGVTTLANELLRRQIAARPTLATPTPWTAAPLAASPLPSTALPAPELPPPASADGLTLMTLESGLTAFDRLGSGALPVQPTAGTPALSFGVFNTPRALAGAFVAAAIVGPCAALRPLGHTPAGW